MKLILNEIRKNFGDKEVLRGASYEFEQGKIYGLLGRNGAGKTTLFKAIYGDYDDFAGDVLLEADNSSAADSSSAAGECTGSNLPGSVSGQETNMGSRRKLEGDDIGMIFSEPMIPEFLTGYEFIKFYMEAHGREKMNIEELFEKLEFPLDDAKRLVKGYSSGMRSKIHIMALLISQPPVMLLDEPLTSLDVVAAAEIKKILMSFRKDHIIIMSTHIMQLAKDMCDEIVLLKDGELEGLEGLDRNAPEYEERIIAALTDKDEARDAAKAEELAALKMKRKAETSSDIENPKENPTKNFTENLKEDPKENPEEDQPTAARENAMDVVPAPEEGDSNV